MIHLSPFENISEHRAFCIEAGIAFEEGAVGFKIFSDEEQLKCLKTMFL